MALRAELLEFLYRKQMPRRPEMKLVIVGNGMVGQRFLEQLVGRTSAQRGDHRVLRGTTTRLRPRAAHELLLGKDGADLSLVKRDFFEKSKMTLRLNDSVLAIDPARKMVRSARYREVPYDKLVIATGSSVRTAGCRRDRRDCFVYRTIEDSSHCGAGAALQGRRGRRRPARLEAAKALQDLGLETHIVEFASRLMAVQLDDSAAVSCAARSRRWVRRSTCRRTRRKSSTATRTGKRCVRRRHQPRDRSVLFSAASGARPAGPGRRARVGERGASRSIPIAAPPTRYLRHRRMRAVARSNVRPGRSGYQMAEVRRAT